MIRLKLRLFVIECILLGFGSHVRAAVLPFGQAQTGTITSAAQTNIYSLSANTGDVIDFTLLATSGNLSPHIQVFTSNGTTPFASAENTFVGCAGGPVPPHSIHGSSVKSLWKYQ
jgi:hypothetical protein